MKRELTLSLTSKLTVRKVIELAALNEMFESEILLEKDSHVCNGKSLLGLMSFLIVRKMGDTFKVIAEGVDAEEVVAHWDYFLANIHQISTLEYWEEQRVQTVQETMNETILAWNPNSRSIAKSYYWGSQKGK